MENPTLENVTLNMTIRRSFGVALLLVGTVVISCSHDESRRSAQAPVGVKSEGSEGAMQLTEGTPEQGIITSYYVLD